MRRIGILTLGFLLFSSLTFCQIDLQADYESEFGPVISFILMQVIIVPEIEGTYNYYIARCLSPQRDCIEGWIVNYQQKGEGKLEFRGRIRMWEEEIQ